MLNQILTGAVELPRISTAYPELRGLLLRNGNECQRIEPEAREMTAMSAYLRRSLLRVSARARPKQIEESSADQIEANIALAAGLKKDPYLRRLEAVPVLTQVLQAEAEPVRLALIEILARSTSVEASELLADRAIFDLSSDVREAARVALASRPPEEYRQRLLHGLRYPWPRVAEHAAEALIALDDRGAASDLARLVELSDPAAPFQTEKGTWVKPELVRVNHLRNCLLCHAPSSSNRDLVRGAMPIPGEPLPRVYYDDPRANFVRADVTYLRQDFSVMRTVAKPDQWPALQRYDYLVRLRELAPAEIAAAASAKRLSDGHGAYPQQTAVLYALHVLSPARSPGKRGATATRDGTASAVP